MATTKPAPRPKSVVLALWQARAARDGHLAQLRVPMRHQPRPDGEPGVYNYRIGRGKYAMNQTLTEMFKRRPSGDELLSSDVATIPLEKWLPQFAAYRVGDVLLCKEPWQAWAEYDGDPAKVLIGPSLTGRFARDNRTRINYFADGNVWDAKLRPAAQMPAWAVRTALTVTAVKVARCDDLTEADAVACGCVAEPTLSGPPCLALSHYRGHWVDRYGPERWMAREWVGVYDVKRCEVPRG